MYKWSISSVIKKTVSLSCQASPPHQLVAGSGSGIFWRALLLAPLLLTGCTDSPTAGRFSQAVQMVIPETKIVDYRTLSCDVLWDLDDKETLENSLYWLRAMDCADRLGSTQARVLAKTLPGVTWSAAFKQGILMSSAEPSIAERRQVVERLNSYSQNFPGAVRPLIQLWREQQILRISLAEERTRYQRLQEESDAQIDRLRESQVRLQYNLLDTTRKLENLTDIERQLSSRKQMQNELPESETENKAAVTPKSTEAKPQPKVESDKPTETKPAETKPAATKATETKPVEAKPAETKPADTYTAPAVQPTDVPPATNKESHDATQTGQSTAG